VLGDTVAGRSPPRPTDRLLAGALTGAAVVVGADGQTNDPAEPADGQLVLDAQRLELSETHRRGATTLERAQFDMRLAQRACEVVDLLAHPRLLPGGLAGPHFLFKALSARAEELLLPLADRCLRHAVSARGLGLSALALQDRQHDLQLSSTGCFGGRATRFSSQSGWPGRPARGVLTQPATGPLYGLASLAA
jgi:hypothetical protein